MLRIAPRSILLPLDQVIGTSSRAYATAPKASGSRKKAAEKVTRGSRAGEPQQDSKLDLIQRTLYESDPTDEARLDALAKVIPSAEVHETISRAWALFTRQQRESQTNALEKRYTSMRKAIDVLEKTDKSLWEKAVGGKKFQNVRQAEGGGNARLEGLVPRELRAPMISPPGKLWDTEWKAPKKET